MNYFKYFLSSFLGAVAGIFTGLFLLFIFIAGVVAVVSLQNKEDLVAKGLKSHSILVIDLNQEIDEISEETVFGLPSNNSLHDIIDTLQEASEDDKITNVLLRMNAQTSMGWATAKELRKALEEFAESKKTITAFGNSMDEKALYVASVAQKIYMHPQGEISWNGFAATPMFYKGFFDKLKMKPVIFKAGKFKSAVEPFFKNKMSPESRQQTEELLEDLWQETLDVVVTSRNVDENTLRDFAEEVSVRTSSEAKKVGLIDGLTRYTDVLEALIKQNEDEGYKVTKKDFKRFLNVQSYKTLKSKKKLFSSLEGGSLFNEYPDTENKIAVLVLEGNIMSGPSAEGVIGSSSVVYELQKLRLDEKIKGVVLRINSPGGSALASDVIWHEMEKLKEVKPVYVSMGNVAASGGYYISAGANKIFADVNTITGSIGVFSVLFNVEETMRDKVGFTFDRVVTNSSSDLGSGVRPMRESEKEIFQEDVTRMYQTFMRVVQKGRAFSKISDVDAIAQGRVWSGQQAKEIGLVDELGSLEDATVMLAGELDLEDYELDYYPKSKGIEALFSRMNDLGVQIKGLQKFMKTPLGSADSLRERLQEGGKVLMLSPYSLKIN